MRIFVTDRRSIERDFLVRSTYALISIRDSGVTRARVPKVAGLRGVLHLAFDDAEPTGSFQLPPDIKLMTEHHARRIWRFVRFHREQVGAFVVHCHQGMSRSPAVAAAMAAYLRINDREFIDDYTPNQHVYRLLLRTMPAADSEIPYEGREKGGITAPLRSSSVTRASRTCWRCDPTKDLKI